MRPEIAHVLRHDVAQGSQSADRVLRVLSLVAGSREAGMTLAELVRKSELTKPTVRRLLVALVRAGFVERTEGSVRYYIGSASYVIGTQAWSRFGVHRLAAEGLARLAEISQDAVFLSVPRDTYAVCLAREEATSQLRNYALQPGDRQPLGVGAGSLAMLAAMPDSIVESVLSVNEPVLERQYPRHQPADVRALVAQTRERGYALNDGRVIPGSWGIAVPVVLASGKVEAALSLATVEHRLQDDRQAELIPLLHDEARQLVSRLEHLQEARPPAGPSASGSDIDHHTRSTEQWNGS